MDRVRTQEINASIRRVQVHTGAVGWVTIIESATVPEAEAKAAHLRAAIRAATKEASDEG